MTTKSVFKGLKVLPHRIYNKRAKGDDFLLYELDNYHYELDPVFHRDGEYLLGNRCWFEVRGRAFKKSKQEFLYELRQLEMGEIDSSVVKKLTEIERLSPRFLTKNQRKLITDYSLFMRIRDARRSAKRITRKHIRASTNV